MIMFGRPGLGCASTYPSSWTSSASRCNSRNPSSGRLCSRPSEHDRDLDLVALLEEPRDVTLLGLVVVRVDFGRSFISLMTVCAWFLRASRAFMADSYLNLP